MDPGWIGAGNDFSSSSSISLRRSCVCPSFSLFLASFLRWMDWTVTATSLPCVRMFVMGRTGSDRQTDRQTDRQNDRQTDRQTYS